jgi:hypothetical protein
MDERELLAKAQEAQAIADAAENSSERRTWETMAVEYLRLAEAVTAQKRFHPPASNDD